MTKKLNIRTKKLKIKRAISRVKKSYDFGILTNFIKLFTVATVSFGYAFLLSYTWPLGFVPVVSIESLPFLMLGLLVLLMFLWGVALSLWLPFDMFVFDKQVAGLLLGNNNESTFRRWFYLTPFVIASVLIWPLGMFLFPLIVCIGLLLIVCWALKFCFVSLDKVTFLAVAPFITLFGAGLIYIWIIFSGDVLRNWQWLFFMAVIYWWFSEIAYKKAGAIQSISLSFLTLVVIIALPIMFSQLGEDPKIKPNILVENGLKLVSLGGEIPVEIIHSPYNNLITGELLFYDGQKAWVHECEVGNIEGAQGSKESSETTVLVTEVVVQKIKYLDSEKVGCLP